MSSTLPPHLGDALEHLGLLHFELPKLMPHKRLDLVQQLDIVLGYKAQGPTCPASTSRTPNSMDVIPA